MEERTLKTPNSEGQLFYDVLRASPIGIALEDLEGRLVFVNPALCTMLGFTQEEMLSRHCVDFSPREDVEKERALFRKLREHLIDRYYLDKRFLRKDGSLVWGRLSISMLSHRSPPIIVTMMQDFTEEMKAQNERPQVQEEERRKVEREHRALETLELVTRQMAGAVTQCDREYRYLWANKGYEDWLQRPLDKIVGRPVVDVLGKEAFEALRPYFEQVLTGKKVHYEQQVNYRSTGLKWISATYTPTFDAAGVPNGWVAVVNDITERKQAEEERLRHAAIVESSDDAMLSLDMHGIIQSWNRGAQQLFGYTTAEAVGSPITILVPDQLRDESKGILQSIGDGEHIEHYETIRVTKERKQIGVSLTISPIRDSCGKIVSACEIVRDISERKRFEKSLLWRLEYEALVSELSRTFINLPEGRVDANMERSLARIGKFLQMDRITLFEFSQDRTNLVMTYSWRAFGVKKAPSSVAIANLPWWRDRVLRGEEALTSQIEDMPEEASAEREYFHQRGIMSAASIPLRVGGEIGGVISFITVKRRVLWTDDLVNQLRVIADILWNALERKHAMEALLTAQAVVRESEGRFRLVANTAPVMIWMSGADKLCTYFNHGWLEFTGRPIELELGEGWAEGVYPEDLERCFDTYKTAFDRRESYRSEYRLRRYDGEYRWVLNQGVPRLNVDGSFAGYTGTCVDVTDRKLAEEAISTVNRRLIEAQEEERTRIARELHDDISQQLALLAVSLQRLKQSLPASANVISREIGAANQQIVDLGNDVQALSHRLHSSKLGVLGLAAASAGFCREFSEQHGVQIDFRSENIARDLPKEASLCLFRVLQEALQNAAKHSGSRHFQVSLKGCSDEVTLTVHDSGIGFEPEEAMRRRGLGLTSMRERLRLVAGELSIDSQPRRGTTVHARIPLSAG
jgi:PAS domain S-box-containing protein